MARKHTRGNGVADQIAEFLGRKIGELMSQKNALQRQLAEVDHQIVAVRDRAFRQFDRYRPAAKSQRFKVVRAAKAASRELSPSTRAKMAEAARLRWARVKRAARAAAKA